MGGNVRDTVGGQGEGLRPVGHCDLGGHGDGMHINLHQEFAFVGHMGDSRVGTSVVDVSDPAKPRLVTQLQTPPGTHSHKVQIVGDVLAVNHERNRTEKDAESWSAGLQLYDVSDPAAPRKLGFLSTPGKGVHRPTWWEGPYAYLSGSDDGYTDQFFIIADFSDPEAPKEVGRWWMPGMHAAGGETHAFPPGRRIAHHHALVRGDRAYCGWWDAGFVILDISDKRQPTLVSHTDFGADVSACTHSVLPVGDKDLLVVTDEETTDDCQGIRKHVRVIDISDETAPRELSKFPVPQGDFCGRGGRFGPHNLHEMRPGTLFDPDTIYLTYFNAGIRVVSIADPASPTEVAWYVPDAPPGQPAIQLNDLIVGADGLVYVTDRFNGGLYVFERTA